MKENREEGGKKKRNLIEHTDERLQPTLSSTRRPKKRKEILRSRKSRYLLIISLNALTLE